MIRLVLTALLLGLSSACSSTPASAPDISLDFHGLWNTGAVRAPSEEPGPRPPDKTALTTWNAASAATPHPDIVNAQVRIAVAGDAPRLATVVMLREEWKIGTRDGEGTATWTARSQRTSPPLDLVPGNTVSVSLPIAVGDMVRRQTKAGRVPWRLAVRAELRDTSSRQTIATAQATLPIVAVR